MRNDADPQASVPIPDGYQYLRPNVEKLLSENLGYEENVFLIMRLLKTDPIKAVHQAIRDALSASGLNPLRADEKDYHPELWANVCTYMLGCSKCVVVFEEIELREFSPNVALELGFMLAMDKPCLILKEKRLPKPPADIIGRLWKEFDSYNPVQTVQEQVSRWLVDIGWRPRPGSIPKAVVRALLKEAARLVFPLQHLSDELKLEWRAENEVVHEFEELGERVYMEVGRVSDLLEELSRTYPGADRILKSRYQLSITLKQEVLGLLRDPSQTPERKIDHLRSRLKEMLAAAKTIATEVEETFGAIE